MSRRRTKLSVVPNTPPAKARKAAAEAAAGILPGLVAGLAAVAAVRYFLSSRKRPRNNSDEVGVLTAEVHSNGRSKVKLGSLDSFS